MTTLIGGITLWLCLLVDNQSPLTEPSPRHITRHQPCSAIDLPVSAEYTVACVH